MSRASPFGLDYIVGRRRSSRIGWVLLLAGGLLTGMAVLDGWEASRDAARWADKAAHWQNMAKPLKARHGMGANLDSAAFRQQVLVAEKAINRLATPWGSLYESLEESIDGSISLLAISPSPEKGELRLTGEAKDFASLRSYLQRLSESGILSDVRLLRQELKLNDAQHPISFSIVAIWRKTS